MGRYLRPCRAADTQKSECFQESLNPVGTRSDDAQWTNGAHDSSEYLIM